MPQITYVEHEGAQRVLEAPLGRTVMEGARDAGVQGILAECGGACSCSTCHVYIAPQWIERVPAIESMEADMLDFAPGCIEGVSRLSCQIRVTADLDGLVVSIPAEQASP